MKEITTVVVPGLVISHIIVAGEKNFSILLARCKKGIVFSESKPLIHAVFVLAGSRDEKKFHLRALSTIAQIVIDLRFEKNGCGQETKRH